jgi:hypothetical protein
MFRPHRNKNTIITIGTLSIAGSIEFFSQSATFHLGGSNDDDDDDDDDNDDGSDLREDISVRPMARRPF